MLSNNECIGKVSHASPARWSAWREFLSTFARRTGLQRVQVPNDDTNPVFEAHLNGLRMPLLTRVIASLETGPKLGRKQVPEDPPSACRTRLATSFISIAIDARVNFRKLLD